ncbi:hypothetical protein B0H11DRAFT_1929385 [Mycena galericulata]|nr:hypothetical protein B0H11DRAFT_1929385 [Mycena galericulata]
MTIDPAITVVVENYRIRREASIETARESPIAEDSGEQGPAGTWGVAGELEAGEEDQWGRGGIAGRLKADPGARVVAGWEGKRGKRGIAGGSGCAGGGGGAGVNEDVGMSRAGRGGVAGGAGGGFGAKERGGQRRGEEDQCRCGGVAGRLKAHSGGGRGGEEGTWGPRRGRRTSGDAGVSQAGWRWDCAKERGGRGGGGGPVETRGCRGRIEGTFGRWSGALSGWRTSGGDEVSRADGRFIRVEIVGRGGGGGPAGKVGVAAGVRDAAGEDHGVKGYRA